MATITRSIGTDNRQYSTITAWEADLDNDTPYDAGDDAVGECYNDSAFDESVTINGGGTLGLNSITLSVASGERHDGTAGSGARIVQSSKTATTGTVTLASAANTRIIYCNWLEIDDSSAPTSNSYGVYISAPPGWVRGCLIHGQGPSDGGASSCVGVYRIHNTFPGTNFDAILNCVIYGQNGGGPNGEDSYGAYTTTSRSLYCYNVTVFGQKTNSDGDPAYGIAVPDVSGITLKNIISAGQSNAGSGGAACFSDSSYTSTVVADLASSDATANGSGALTNLTIANQFVSTTAGSEDLHLKYGADCIDAGTDLGTTPTGVNIDIDGRDRDAEADTWDIGADETQAASATWFEDWAHRIKLTINAHNEISQNLTDWTLVFDQSFDSVLTSTNGPLDADGTRAMVNGGGDIRMTKADGVTRIPIDVRAAVTNNDPASASLEVACKVATLSYTAATEVYLYWGKSGASQPGPDGLYGQYNAYTSDYTAVYTMSDATTSTVSNRCANTYHGTKTAANEPVEATGQIGDAQSFDDSNDAISISPQGLLDFGSSGWAVEAVINPDSISASTDRGIIIAQDAISERQFIFQINVANDGDFRVAYFTPTQQAFIRTTNSGHLSASSWHFIAARRQVGVSLLWYNGSAVPSTTSGSGSESGSIENKNSTIYIGRRGYSGDEDYYDGLIDELRVSTPTRNNDWLIADYNNLLDVGTFLTFGSIEDEGAPPVAAVVPVYHLVQGSM